MVRRGLELAQGFYYDVVTPLIDVPHAASLIGEGSEVLGYDQDRSKDHSWGPRLQLFVEDHNVERVQYIVDTSLPSEYDGYPVRFYSWQTETVRHHVEVSTLEKWLRSHLRFVHPSELTSSRWLTMPQQHLLQFTSGKVFHDDLGNLSKMREILAWYPRDVWLWIMAAQWQSIASTEHFLGRTAEALDYLGSHLNAFRLVQRIMELAFLHERRYYPYPKWFGTAFSRLQISQSLGPIINSVLPSANPQAREDGINRALVILAKSHNSLGLTRPVPPTLDHYHVGINNAVRPYLVLNAGDYAKACLDAISDASLRNLPLIGALDQLVNVTDLFINFTTGPAKLEALYTLDSNSSISFTV